MVMKYVHKQKHIYGSDGDSGGGGGHDIKLL